MPISKDEIESFKDPATYLKYRKRLEDGFFRGFDGQLKDSEKTKELAKTFVETMKQRTSESPGLLEKLVPDFAPNCRRITPGPGYLEA
jgi:hypothetical protein